MSSVCGPRQQPSDPQPISPLINSRDHLRHAIYRRLCRKVTQYPVLPMLGLDFINGLIERIDALHDILAIV